MAIQFCSGRFMHLQTRHARVSPLLGLISASSIRTTDPPNSHTSTEVHMPQVIQSPNRTSLTPFCFSVLKAQHGPRCMLRCRLTTGHSMRPGDASQATENMRYLWLLWSSLGYLNLGLFPGINYMKASGQTIACFSIQMPTQKKNGILTVSPKHVRVNYYKLNRGHTKTLTLSRLRTRLRARSGRGTA